MAICDPCRKAADTDDMDLHDHCQGIQNGGCFCQHKSKKKYPSQMQKSADLSATPTPNTSSVQHF